MFIAVILFIISLIAEIILVLFTSPFDSSKQANYLITTLFSINTGVLLGTFYTFLLLGFYLIIGAYTELQNRGFLRRGILLGALVSLVLTLKMFKILDTFILIFCGVIFVCVDVILSEKLEER